ncbi:MAG: hypothetical protein PUC06_04375 [Oscillospiraceae bacterium]|nr:hypothetical protein [Oscillospiraceae bacterium]
MTFELLEISEKLRSAPGETIAAYEAEYFRQVDAIADAVLDNRKNSPVVLLAGPSGSGKTTTGTRLMEHLRDKGVPAHLISMDNYYRNWDLEDFPLTETGAYDLESPLCLDIPLLNEHFAALEAGQAIEVPIYHFPTHSRLEGETIPMVPTGEDIFIFEGIHALNERMTEKHPGAFRLYVSPTAEFLLGGKPLCGQTMLRMIRRVVRDMLFRGADGAYTLSLWENVVAAEKINIEPYRKTANGEINTALGYELSVLRTIALPVFEGLGQDTPCKTLVDEAVAAMEQIPPVSAELVPGNSILREFIGG